MLAGVRGSLADGDTPLTRFDRTIAQPKPYGIIDKRTLACGLCQAFFAANHQLVKHVDSTARKADPRSLTLNADGIRCLKVVLPFGFGCHIAEQIGAKGIDFVKLGMNASKPIIIN